MIPFLQHRASGWIVALLAALTVLWTPSVVAQGNVVDGPAEVDPRDSDDAPAEDSGSTDAASPIDALMRDFGVETDISDNPDAIEAYSDSAASDLTRAEKARESLQAELEVVGPVVKTFESQVANEGLPIAARSMILQDLARVKLDRAKAQAAANVLEREISKLKQMLELLAQLEKEIKTEADTSDDQRRRQAAEEEEAALEALARARAREAAERDDTLKKLAAREREAAEQTLGVTREFNEQIETISEETRKANDAFLDTKASILEKLDELPDDPAPSTAKKYGDPALQQAVTERRDLRERLYTAVDRLDEVTEQVDERETELARSRDQLETERELFERGSNADSELFRRRVAVAEAEAALAEKRLEQAREIEKQVQARVDSYEEQLYFYNSTIDDVLPRVSDDARDEFFQIGDNDNLRDAQDGVRDGVRKIYEGAVLRFDQAVEHLNNLGNPELWTFILALLFRLLIAAAAAFFLPRWIPWVINRVVEFLMGRRYFRRHPTVVVKLAEILRGVTGPLIVYGALQYVLGAVVPVLPEFRVLAWVIDAIYAYIIVVEITTTMVLPRWHRRQQEMASAESFEAIDETEAKAVADFLNVGLLRGKKLLRSARVITIFWLLSFYVPDLVRMVTGTSIISNLVDFVATWSFVGIVYWVLSTWRDDIAVLFDKVAKERLPEVITNFVAKRKDGVLGVLVIGVASIYVLIFEAYEFLRHYLIDTDAFKRASNFAFRKKIEYQARDRDTKDEDDPAEVSLSPEFEAIFEEDICLDEAYELMPDDQIAHVMAHLTVWLEKRRQGSVAFVGETGLGKTSLLLRIGKELDEREDSDLPVVVSAVRRKRTRRRDVLSLVAELFDLEDTFDTKESLIAAIADLEPRIVVLDDCHNVVFRKIGGFEGLETLLDIINLTDETHFYIISFNSFAWEYVDRVRSREAYFGSVRKMPAWSEAKVQELIERRVEELGFSVSYNELVITGEGAGQADYLSEVVKTATGYFRYLTEFSRGNPRVAMAYWLRSLRPDPSDPKAVAVSLFRRPSDQVFAGFSDPHWFVLTAITQHGSLDPSEVADIVNLEQGFCMLALNLFVEREIVWRDDETGRVRLRPVYFRQVLRHLANSNFLYS